LTKYDVADLDLLSLHVQAAGNGELLELLPQQIVQQALDRAKRLCKDLFKGALSSRDDELNVRHDRA
jgi:hypothetical protein